MKPLVIAALTLALAGAALAQDVATGASDTPAEQARRAATGAEQAAQEAATAAERAAAEAGALAEQAADDAAAAADSAADAAAMAADDAASAAAGMGDAAARDAADAAGDAAAAADSAAREAAEAAGKAAGEVVVTPPDVNPPSISEAEPGVLSSWVTSRRIWTTNQPSSTAWVDPQLAERPVAWQDIAKVNDIVLDDSGQVVGYVADIGGFLGIGAKKVLLGEDAIHLVSVGSDTFFATNYTKAELEALPDFDEKTVRK